MATDEDSSKHPRLQYCGNPKSSEQAEALRLVYREILEQKFLASGSVYPTKDTFMDKLHREAHHGTFEAVCTVLNAAYAAAQTDRPDPNKSLVEIFGGTHGKRGESQQLDCLVDALTHLSKNQLAESAAPYTTRGVKAADGKQMLGY